LNIHWVFKGYHLIITFGNTKGGVGKSTIAVNLAVARLLAGRNVWLIDADLQASTSMALAIRSTKERVMPQHTHCADGPQLVDLVRERSGNFDDTVIDVGGRDSTALRAALVVSDLVVVPFTPRSIDVWALRDMNSLIGEARKVQPSLRAVGVLSMADVQGQDNRDAAAALEDFSEISLVDAPLRRRKSVANALGEGLSVLEYEPVDAKARQELQALYDHIFDSR
jgi:chromosome partitioning protein